MGSGTASFDIFYNINAYAPVIRFLADFSDFDNYVDLLHYNVGLQQVDYYSQEKMIFDNVNPVPHGFYVDPDKTTKEASVAPDGSTVIDIYYTRQIHTISYNFGDKFPEEEPVQIRYRYEENLYAPNFFMVGYEFIGWDEEDGVIEGKMDDKDITYVAQWKPNENTPYYVEYYIGNPLTEDYEMLGGSFGRLYNEGKTGDSFSVSDFCLDNQENDPNQEVDPEMPDAAGYVFQQAIVNGKEAGLDTRVKITADVPAKVELYYKGVEYALTFDPNGGTITTPASDIPYYYTHGLTLSVSGIDAQKYGYIFNGWYEGEEPVDTITAARKGAITLTAGWRPQTSLITCTIRMERRSSVQFVRPMIR